MSKYTFNNDWAGFGFATGIVVIIALSIVLPKLLSGHHHAAAAKTSQAILAATTTPIVDTDGSTPTDDPAQSTPAPTPAPEPLSVSGSVSGGKYDGWKSYTSKKYGLAFNYPSAWDMHEVETANPADSESIQLTVNLTITVNDKTLTVVSLTARNATLDALEKIHDDINAQNPIETSKQSRVNDYGRKVLIYGDGTGTAWASLYLIADGSKTYGVYDANSLHYGDPGDDTYWADFERLYESIVLQ